MSDPVFFAPFAAVTVAEIAGWAGAELPRGGGDTPITAVGPLDDAGAGCLVFLDNPKYVSLLDATEAAACLVAPKHVSKLPAAVVPIVAAEPYRAWAMVLARLYPDAVRPQGITRGAGISPQALVDRTAVIEPGAVIEAGAVVGPGAEIGQGTRIAAGAVIGAGVRIGRDCSIEPGVTVQAALIGNRVILHPGVRIGQDGFGFAMGPRGHLKVPQVGRVIIQDDVEIGANTTVDRGANRDTVIGEGTKIDNQVQVGHNVVIGRHCVIVAQVGLSGSCRLGDFVAIGGQSGVKGHVTVGTGAQIAAVSAVEDDVPPGGRYGGVPAKPVKLWFREVTALRQLAERGQKE